MGFFSFLSKAIGTKSGTIGTKKRRGNKKTRRNRKSKLSRKLKGG